MDGVRICMLSVLGINSIIDIRKREISILYTGIFGILSILLFCMDREFTWLMWFGGILSGISMMGLSKITKGAFGFGDGLLLMVTGSYLGIWRNLELLFISLMIAALFSIGLLILRKANLKKELPFVPFLLLGYVFLLLFGWES